MSAPSSFFARNNLAESDARLCWAFAAEALPSHSIQALARQGGCSFVLIATDPLPPDPPADLEKTTIIQFRLLKHALPIPMAKIAHHIYSPLAPQTRSLGLVSVGNGVLLQAAAMSCLPGQRFSDVQPRSPVLDAELLQRLRNLIRSLSTFFAQNWHARSPGRRGMQSCTGKVGGSLLSRLGSLGLYAPSAALREKAREVEQAVREGVLEHHPAVLTHGDLLPSNMLVDGSTWMVKGYVDWAEAEWLPFGMCFYGLEHVLGYVEASGKGGRPRFVYYAQADELRKEFWTLLEVQVPELLDVRTRAQVLLVRDIGIFLWKGFAWDDGAIDRVVNGVDDAEEVACLQAFLGLYSAAARHDSVLDDKETLEVLPDHEVYGITAS